MLIRGLEKWALKMETALLLSEWCYFQAVPLPPVIQDYSCFPCHCVLSMNLTDKLIFLMVKKSTLQL